MPGVSNLMSHVGGQVPVTTASSVPDHPTGGNLPLSSSAVNNTLPSVESAPLPEPLGSLLGLEDQIPLMEDKPINNGMHHDPYKGSGLSQLDSLLEPGFNSHHTSPQQYDNNTPQVDKSKGQLKGWSSLAGQPVNPVAPASSTAMPANKTSSRAATASDTFAAFQKAAKEKEARERTLQEQKKFKERQKESEERDRQRHEIERQRQDKERHRVEMEKRKEQEEENALEQARRSMMGASNPAATSASSNNAPVSSRQPPPAAPSRPLTVAPPRPSPTGSNSGSGPPPPVSMPASQSPSPAPSPADLAKQERDRLRAKEQDKRRREAERNRIDMNRQSDLMAAFEENII